MYWSGAPMKNVRPVSADKANPAFAQGISIHAALVGTRLMNPRRQRSKKPATPTRSDKPKKCRISHRGQSHGATRLASESDVPRSQNANASSSAVMECASSDVRHVSSGHDRQEPHRE